MVSGVLVPTPSRTSQPPPSAARPRMSRSTNCTRPPPALTFTPRAGRSLLGSPLAMAGASSAARRTRSLQVFIAGLRWAHLDEEHAAYHRQPARRAVASTRERAWPAPGRAGGAGGAGRSVRSATPADRAELA